MAPSRSLPTASYHQLRNRFDMWHCYKLWKNKRMFFRHEGYKGFYKGLAANLLRVTPACCITFYTYELLMQHLPELNVTKCVSSSWYIYISPFRAYLHRMQVCSSYDKTVRRNLELVSKWTWRDCQHLCFAPLLRGMHRVKGLADNASQILLHSQKGSWCLQF